MDLVVNQYDGSTTTTTNVATAQLGTLWAKYEVSFLVPTVSSAPAGSKHYLGVGFDTTRLNTPLDLAKVKLERGLVATTNPPSNISQELINCSRYHQRSYTVDENTHSVTMLGKHIPNVSVVDVTINPMHRDYYYRFPVTMRGTPTVNFFSPETGTTGDAYNRTAQKDIIYTSGTNGFNSERRHAPAGAKTIDDNFRNKDGMYVVFPVGNVQWDQISFHYVADAELDENL